MPIRLDKELITLLDEGVQRTPHKKQELIRLTLRRHLKKIIDEEAARQPVGRITNVDPWPKGALAAAYKSIESENWDAVENAASRSRRPPSFED